MGMQIVLDPPFSKLYQQITIQFYYLPKVKPISKMTPTHIFKRFSNSCQHLNFEIKILFERGYQNSRDSVA